LLCGPAVSSQPFPPADGGGHVVRFDQIVFICGKQNNDSGNRRFIHSVPEAKYIPEFEPPSGDPLLPSWLVTYRIICEQGK